MQGIYNPPNTHFRMFPVEDKFIPHIGRIIGKEGRHFIRLTNQCRVEYIWFQEGKKYIEVWGPEDKLDNAEQVIIKHMMVTLSQCI